MKAGTLLLVDANNLLWRAYYAVGVGRAVKAFVGRTQTVARALEATHVLIVFDAGGDGGRRALLPQYKATRQPHPPEALALFPAARRAVEASALLWAEDPAFEADDVIASYTRAAVAEGMRVVIVSNDKDLAQLCGPLVDLYDTATRARVTAEQVEQRWGVPPSLLGDLLALTGDSSDNVPGVPGIGPKRAAALLAEHGSLEQLLEHADGIAQPKRRAALLEHAESARLSRRIVELLDCPLPIALECLSVAVAEHRCHARGCLLPCPPRHLMCGRHWGMVPPHIRAVVWNSYRPGQEIDKRPSPEWSRAAEHAVEAVLKSETLSLFDGLQEGVTRKHAREYSRSPNDRERERQAADERRRQEIREQVEQELARRRKEAI